MSAAEAEVSDAAPTVIALGPGARPPVRARNFLCSDPDSEAQPTPVVWSSGESADRTRGRGGVSRLRPGPLPTSAIGHTSELQNKRTYRRCVPGSDG